MTGLRPDLAAIAAHVAPGSRVLDIGCGDGALMAVLEAQSGCDARGMELDGALVERCVSRGLSVVQGDANLDLANYPDKAFDYAILSQTLQTARAPDRVLDELLRIGRHAFVSFPNFAHWRTRAALLVVAVTLDARAHIKRGGPPPAAQEAADEQPMSKASDSEDEKAPLKT